MPVLQNRVTQLLVHNFVASFSAELPGFKPYRVNRYAINFVYENTPPSSCLQKLFTEFIVYSLPAKALWKSKRRDKRILDGFPKDIARAVLSRMNQRASGLHQVGILHDFPRFIDPVAFAMSPVSEVVQNLSWLCRMWYAMFNYFRVPDDADAIYQENACQRAYSVLPGPIDMISEDCYLWYGWLLILRLRIGEIAIDNPRVSRLLWRYVASHDIAIVWIRDYSQPSARLPKHDASGLSLCEEFGRVFGLTAPRIRFVGGDDPAPNPFMLRQHWRQGLQSLDRFIDLSAFLVDEKC